MKVLLWFGLFGVVNSLHHKQGQFGGINLENATATLEFNNATADNGDSILQDAVGANGDNGTVQGSSFLEMSATVSGSDTWHGHKFAPLGSGASGPVSSLADSGSRPGATTAGGTHMEGGGPAGGTRMGGGGSGGSSSGSSSEESSSGSSSGSSSESSSDESFSDRSGGHLRRHAGMDFPPTSYVPPTSNKRKLEPAERRRRRGWRRAASSSDEGSSSGGSSGQDTDIDSDIGSAARVYPSASDASPQVNADLDAPSKERRFERAERRRQQGLARHAKKLREKTQSGVDSDDNF